MTTETKGKFKQLSKKQFSSFEEAKQFVAQLLTTLSGSLVEHRGRVRKRAGGKFDGIVFAR